MLSQHIDSTSSIGAAWPPAEATHNRMRGFYPEVVRSQEEFDEFMRHFNKAQEATVNHEVMDRLSIRAVASQAIIAALDQHHVTLEGAMPVRDSDLFVLYAGWNSASRQPTPEKLSEHQTLIANAASTPRVTQSETAHLASKGFVPRIIDRFTPDAEKKALTDRFGELYANFGYDAAEVEELLLNPANTIAFIENADGVISTAMAEKATVEVAGHGAIHMAEITEAFTLPSYRGQGLYKDVSGLLVRTLLDTPQEELDIIYGESNLTMPGVIIAAHQNGRQFSHLDREALGVTQPDFGILQQNFSVNDGTETRPYNDFALSYVPLG